MSDVKFAKHIIKQYSTGLDGFSDGECQDLIYKGFKGGEDEGDVYLKNSQCRALQDVLGPGREGAITKKEREHLSSAGFSKKFISTLAGKDGKWALKHRVLWLGEFYLTYMGASKNVDKKALDGMRHEAFEELASMGRDARGAMPALIEAAKSEDESIRRMAAETLSKIGSDAAEAIPALITILNNEKGKESRIAAAKTLARIGVLEPSAKALAGVFRKEGNDKELRLTAIEAFTELCSQPDINPNKRNAFIYWLILVSQDDDRDIRETVKAAFKTLKVSDEIIVKTLIGILRDEKSDLRGFAARALGRWGKKAADAVPTLIDVFRNDEDEYMRIDAAEALANIATPQAFTALGESGSKEAVEAFESALLSPDERVRKAAAYLIGNIGTPSNIPDLFELLEDPENEVRQAAVRSIGKLGVENNHALALLTNALDDTDPKVRVTAMRWIANMGSYAKKKFKDIEPLLKDENIDVRTVAIKTLLRINPNKAIESFKDLGEYTDDAILVLMRGLKSKDWAIRRAVLITFGNLREKAVMAAPILEGTLVDSSIESRERALAAVTLGRIGVMDASTIAAFLVGKEDESKKVSKVSRNALKKKSITKLIPPLLEIVGDVESDIAVRKAATNYLAKLGKKAAIAVPKLIDMLGSSDDETRIMSAYVVASIGPKAKDAQDALLAARDSGSERLKKTAAIALDKIGYEEPKVVEPKVVEPKVVEPKVVPVEVDAPQEKVATVADLVEAISSGESADRRKAAVQLSKMGKEIKKVRGGLITLLKEGDDLARELSAIVLFSSKANSKKVLKAWVHALADSNIKVKSLATAALNKNAKKAAPFLIAAIKKGEEANKIAALKCLAPMGKLAKPAIKTIAKFLDSESPSLRKAASDAIIKLGKHAAPIIPNMIAKLESEKKSTRTMAAIILWKLGARSKHVIKAFIKRLDDEEKGVRTIARMALAKIGGDVVPFLIKAYGKGSFSKKIVILGMLGELGAHADEAMDFLLEVIGTDELAARRVAAGILVRLGAVTADYIEELSEILLEGDDLAREQAAFILWKLGPKAKDAREALVEATKDEAGRVSEYAKKALAAIDSLVAAGEAQ